MNVDNPFVIAEYERKANKIQIQTSTLDNKTNYEFNLILHARITATDFIQGCMYWVSHKGWAIVKICTLYMAKHGSQQTSFTSKSIDVKDIPTGKTIFKENCVL